VLPDVVHLIFKLQIPFIFSLRPFRFGEAEHVLQTFFEAAEEYVLLRVLKQIQVSGDTRQEEPSREVLSEHKDEDVYGLVEAADVSKEVQNLSSSSEAFSLECIYF